MHNTPEEGLTTWQDERLVLHVKLQFTVWLCCAVLAEMSQPVEGSTKQHNRPSTTVPKKKQRIRHGEEMDSEHLGGEVIILSKKLSTLAYHKKQYIFGNEETTLTEGVGGHSVCRTITGDATEAGSRALH